MRDIVPIFLRVPPREIAFVKFLFESYEGVGVVRTVDPREAIVVVLAVPDFVDIAREVVASLQRETPCEEISAPPRASGDWLLEAIEEES